MRKLTTALVPLNRLNRVLNGSGAQGWLRMGFNDGAVYRKGRVIHGPFDLVTPDRIVVEALVESWKNHNILISVPQNRLVATYGLRPRVIDSDQSVRWDDPEHINYDVVEVRPYSKYTLPNEYTRSEVLLRQDYAEDYADVRSRAIVAVYYEEHSIADDEELDILLGGGEYHRIDVPGVGIEIKRNPFNTEYPLFIAAWGCHLLVRPSGKLRITKEEKPSLKWPGVGVVRSSVGFSSKTMMDRVYVRDAVLTAFEEKPEFEVHPESGSVSYEGRWALGFCHRASRDYIGYEPRKLYEGCPPSVIRHVHQFVVDSAEANAQREKLGTANIGARAAAFVAAFLRLQREVHAVAGTLGVSVAQSAIASPTPDEVKDRGWWTFDELRGLGHVAPQEMSRTTCLSRAATLFAPLDMLREKPMRKILSALGAVSDDVKGFGSLKLLGAIAQIATAAVESGLNLRTDAPEVLTRWNHSLLVPSLKPLFALNQLRQLASHTPPSNAAKLLKDALKVFGIDVATVTGGWGRVLDMVYDEVTRGLQDLAALLHETTASESADAPHPGKR